MKTGKEQRNTQSKKTQKKKTSKKIGIQKGRFESQKGWGLDMWG